MDSSFFENLVEDLITLEVATLTSTISDSFSLKDDETKYQNQNYIDANTACETAKTDLLSEIGKPDNNQKIRVAKRKLKQAQKNLELVKEALGIYDPKDIFSKVRAKLSDAQLVAYSRFELEGDSINFINNNSDFAALNNQHKEFVAASQEARKALFDTVSKFIKK